MTQREALTILQNGHNVFLTGPAGSGKTHLLRELIADARQRGKTVAVTASTGIAATHLDGITIHSWSGMGIMKSASPEDILHITHIPRLAKRFKHTDILIIDEVSMLQHYQLDIIDAILQAARASWRPFGGIQVVLCGDFFQLPPVSTEEEPGGKFAYEATAWDNGDFKVCYLEEQFRQSDPVMARILNDIRGRKATAETKYLLMGRYQKPIVGIAEPTQLFPHNASVDVVNDQHLMRLPGEAHTYTMSATGKDKAVMLLKRSCLAPDVFTLKKGARVIFVKNSFEEGYVNGTTGEVVDFEGRYPVVKTKNGKLITAREQSWKLDDGEKTLAEIRQLPLRLAWAITVHKSQGMSLDAAKMDLAQTFVQGMGYVALSRLRTLDGLSLLGMNDLALKVSEEVYAVDQTMRAASAEFLRTFVPGVPSSAAPAPKMNSETYLEAVREHSPNAYRPWTSEKDERLADEYRSGLSIEALAVTYGRKTGAIQSRLRKLGLIE